MRRREPRKQSSRARVGADHRFDYRQRANHSRCAHRRRADRRSRGLRTVCDDHGQRGALSHSGRRSGHVFRHRASQRYQSASEIAIVLPGEREEIAFTLQAQLKEIARVEAKGEAFPVGSTSDTFTVTGDAARASSPNESPSGLANYTQGSVQGAIAGVPGVQFDSFANAIVRGGKVQDTVYDYDSVPIPQGLIAEPGGNIVGAQLGTTGVAATTLTLSGFTDVSQNALGGVVNEIPAIGTYPARGYFEIAGGIGAAV